MLKAHADDGIALTKCLVPASDSLKAMADLDAMGVNHADVYPEIEGSAQMSVFRTVLAHKVQLEASFTSS